MFVSLKNRSNFISLLKFTLPFVALVLMATVFLFAGKVDPTKAIRYSELNVDDIIIRQRILRPVFAGQTETGVSVKLSASYADAVRGDQRVADIHDIEVLLENLNGTVFAFKSQSGRMDSLANIASLTDGVTIAITGGYDVHTNQLITDFNTGNSETGVPIVARIPYGELSAGNMRIITAEGAQKLHFTNGVKLLYHSKSKGGV